MTELGVAVQQGHGIERDQLPGGVEHHRIDFQVLPVFIVEAQKQLSGEVGHFGDQVTGEPGFFRKGLERRVRRSIAHDHGATLHAIPIGLDFNPAAIGDHHVRTVTGRLHGNVIFLAVVHGFGHDHFPNGQRADGPSQHFFRRGLGALEIQAHLHEAEFKARSQRLMGFDHQRTLVQPIIGLRQLFQFFGRTDHGVIRGLQTPLSQQAHSRAFKYLCHNATFVSLE